MEIRMLSAEERLSTTVPLSRYAFMPSPAAAEVPGDDWVRANRDTVTFAAQEGGETLAAVAAVPMRQNVRGRVVPMAGIASVASHPLARRRGLVRELMRQAHAHMRTQGCVTAALYPFRPSFYAQFGYVGLPGRRRATFPPAGLGHLVRAQLPGSVAWRSVRDGYDEHRAFTLGQLERTHGFSVFPDSRAGQRRDRDEHWLVSARDSGGRTGGVATYRIERQGGDLVGDTFLYDGVLGRSLLLQFFARHVDQVARVVLPVGPHEVPELWGVDFSGDTTTLIDHPEVVAPMGRVLDVAGLAGIGAGDGETVVEVAGAGRWRLAGRGGRLVVQPSDEEPGARLSVAGFSGLVLGVLSAEEVAVRGLGTASGGALDALFPRELPYLFESF